MSDSVQIKIGGATVNDRRPTKPLKTTQDAPEMVEPAQNTPKASQEATGDVRPRSLQEIMAERGAAPAETRDDRQRPMVLKLDSTTWIYVGIGAFILAALLIVAVILVNQKPQETPAASVAAPTAAPNNASVPLSDRFPSGATVQPTVGQSHVDGATVVATKNGVSLVKMQDGTYGLQLVDKNASCVPNFWSPPPAWAIAETETKFASESALCTATGTHIQVIGYWKDTTWIFWAAPKVENADPMMNDQWSFMWTDAAWHGLKIEDVKAITGVKDMYQPPVPAQPPAQPAQPYVPDQPYVPADDPPAQDDDSPAPSPTPYAAPTTAQPYYVGGSVPTDVPESSSDFGSKPNDSNPPSSSFGSKPKGNPVAPAYYVR